MNGSATRRLIRRRGVPVTLVNETVTIIDDSDWEDEEFVVESFETSALIDRPNQPSEDYGELEDSVTVSRVAHIRDDTGIVIRPAGIENVPPTRVVVEPGASGLPETEYYVVGVVEAENGTVRLPLALR